MSLTCGVSNVLFCCSQTMKYDLGDCAIWEYMFPSNDKPLLQLPDEDDYGDDLDDDVSIHLWIVFT